MPKNAQCYGAPASFPVEWPVIKISKLTNMKNWFGWKEHQKGDKNTEKPMPENVVAQSYEAFILVLFSAWPVTKILESANKKNSNIIGKSIHDQKHKEAHA